MTGFGCAPIPDPLHQSLAAWVFWVSEKKAQLALGPVMRLQR